ncbi:GT-D fold domain-containing glycosyltransferase [Paenibacillus sp. FSL R5-0341]|uniref:GT-D fold domain-containing protein n=1 Tax=Paenibacillus sp. FSL R5-0341 TaxID=2921636 RepID=UPI0030D555E5
MRLMLPLCGAPWEQNTLRRSWKDAPALCAATILVHAKGGNGVRVAIPTRSTGASVSGKPRGTHPAVFMGSGTPAGTGTGPAGVRGVKSGKRSTQTKAGTSAGAAHKVRAGKAGSTGSAVGRAGKAGPANGSNAGRASRTGKGKAGLRQATAGRRAAPARGRRAAARAKQRTAMRRAPLPAPQASTPQAMPASGAGPAPRQATLPKGVAPAGREGAAAANAGSAKGLPAPAQPAEHAVQAQAVPGGYAEGYRDGVFAGGEALVAQHIPPDHILPAVAAADLIAAGFRQYAPSLARLASPHEMAGHITAALDAQRPLSVVRLGDGELLTLAADTVLPGQEVQELAPFLPYAGVPCSTPDIRAMLAEAIQSADWVGVPISRAPTFQGLLFPVLRHFGIDWSRLKLTSSTINYSLHQSGLVLPVLQGRRVLLIGSQAEELAALLHSRGIHVTGIIGSVAGVMDVPRVMQQTAEHAFDIALVAAGIPAVILCRRIAGELGKVALDFGHLADKLVTGELQL